MKLLLFAHTPPPHHGQSYMVQLMLNGLGGDRRTRLKNSKPHPGDVHGIECYHVNTRLSKRLEEIGSFQPMNINYGLLPPMDAPRQDADGKKIPAPERGRAKKKLMSERALADLNAWLSSAPLHAGELSGVA